MISPLGLYLIEASLCVGVGLIFASKENLKLGDTLSFLFLCSVPPFNLLVVAAAIPKIIDYLNTVSLKDFMKRSSYKDYISSGTEGV